MSKYEESLARTAASQPLHDCTILITGATGLIGSCLIDVLLYANDYHDANIHIYALGRSEKRIHNRFNGRVTPVIQDINQPLDISVSYDYIVHAASNADPRMYATHLAETLLTNIIGTRNVLEYCKEHLETKMFLTSTFEVYGNIENTDVYTEDMAGVIDFHILRNGYPESKRCAEILVGSYVRDNGVRAVIGRLASIYGPTMLPNDSKAHAQFIRNALAGENIVLKSAGTQKRTYCYVVDVVSAILCLLEKGSIGETYNISNEKSIATIAEVAECCATIAGTKVVFDLPDEVERVGFSRSQNCILDNGKLRRLGWYGTYTLRDGLMETISTLST